MKQFFGFLLLSNQHSYISLPRLTDQQLLPLLNGTTGTGSLYLAVPGGPYGFLSDYFTSSQDTTWTQVSLTCENMDT